MFEPYRGRAYDPCYGSAGTFVQSVEFTSAHAKGNGNGDKTKAEVSIYGPESKYTTRRRAKMDFALRGIDGRIAHGDTLHNDPHPHLETHFILANRRSTSPTWLAGGCARISGGSMARPAPATIAGKW